MHPKLLYISHAVSNIYGTEIEIWTGFRLVGNTVKNWANYEQLMRAVFSCFYGQKKSKMYVASTLKNHIK